VREFKSAARAAATGEDTIEFKMDDDVFRATRPSEGQLAMVMAVIGDYASTEEQMATIINFYVAMLDDPSRKLAKRRLLMDRTMDVLDVMEHIQFLVEEWSTHPTKRSSDSTSSLVRTGPRSMATVQDVGSTPLPSAPTVFATSPMPGVSRG
jgi:hypothetical protein